MRVLVCHVYYSQPGGEDVVFQSEAGLLRDAGVDVSTLELYSGRFHDIPLQQRARMTLTYPDHDYGHKLMRALITQHRPDVVHFHNVYPQLGPGAMLEADRLGCATLQTLHNHRLSCLTGTYLRAGAPCESCAPERFATGVRYGCYRGSRAQSLLVAWATTRQWRNFLVRRTPLYLLALTPFVRQFYAGLGAPAERILVKANSVDAGEPSASAARSGALCGGLLSPEKGIVPLMRAWPDEGPVLTVAGDGPLRAQAQAAVKHNVRYVGHLPHESMREAMREARVVVMPSVSSEGLPLVALEAFSEGTPVVAFEGWSLGSILGDLSPQCVTRALDFSALARRACDLAAASDWDDLSERCVDSWRDNYSHSANVESLLRIYEAAIALKRGIPA